MKLLGWKQGPRSSPTPQSVSPMYFPQSFEANQTGSKTLQGCGSRERESSELKETEMMQLQPCFCPASSSSSSFHRSAITFLSFLSLLSFLSFSSPFPSPLLPSPLLPFFLFLRHSLTAQPWSLTFGDTCPPGAGIKGVPDCAQPI